MGENLEELKRNGFYEHCDEILREKSKLIGKSIDREDIIHSFDNAKGTFYEHCDEILREKSKLIGKSIDREDIIHSFDNAKGTDGSIAILKGNLAPEGCVIKHTACPKNMFQAVLRAKPYDSEEECIAAVLHGEVKPGDALAPEGCVIKHTACPKNMFQAVLRAKPYDSEEECIAAVLHGEVKPGDAICHQTYSLSEKHVSGCAACKTL